MTEKPQLPPAEVLAGFRVPPEDAQRRSIFALLDAEIEQANAEQFDSTISDTELRSRVWFKAGLRHFRDQLDYIYQQANMVPVKRGKKSAA